MESSARRVVEQVLGGEFEDEERSPADQLFVSPLFEKLVLRVRSENHARYMLDWLVSGWTMDEVWSDEVNKRKGRVSFEVVPENVYVSSSAAFCYPYLSIFMS